MLIIVNSKFVISTKSKVLFFEEIGSAAPTMAIDNTIEINAIRIGGNGNNLISPIHDQLNHSPENSPQPVPRSFSLDWLHYFMFSNRFSAALITIVIVIFQVNSIYQDVAAKSNLLSFCDEFSWLIEIVFNMYFGHCFMRDNMLEQIICSSSSKKRQGEYVSSLERIFALAYILSWINAFPWVIIQSIDGPGDTFGFNYTWLSVSNTLVWQYYLFVNFYLCGLWCWIIFVKYSVFQTEIIKKINMEDPLAFKIALFDFDKQLTIDSAYWRTNHIIRTVTGLMIIIYHVSRAYLTIDTDSYEFLASVLTIILYYGSIWWTYICAGYVNDRVRTEILLSLNSVVTEDDSMINRLMFVMNAVCTSFRGFCVSGFHINTTQSVGVGYIMLVIVIILVKLHLIATS